MISQTENQAEQRSTRPDHIPANYQVLATLERDGYLERGASLCALRCQPINSIDLLRRSSALEAALC